MHLETSASRSPSQRLSRRSWRRRARFAMPGWGAGSGRRRKNPPPASASGRGRAAAKPFGRDAAHGAVARNAPARRPSRPATARTVHQEVLQGMAIGLMACLFFAWVGGGSFLVFQFAAVWGSCFGALIGLVLWAGSVDLPEDTVPPPAKGQERETKEGSEPRQRR